MDESARIEIVDRLIAVARSVVPDAAFVNKYGGLVVERIAGDAGSQFCGIFAHKAHVSLEFSHGAKLNDPQSILAGAGKNRRHIKIVALAEIESKHCVGFLKQALCVELAIIRPIAQTGF